MIKLIFDIKNLYKSWTFSTVRIVRGVSDRYRTSTLYVEQAEILITFSSSLHTLL